MSQQQELKAAALSDEHELTAVHFASIAGVVVTEAQTHVTDDGHDSDVTYSETTEAVAHRSVELTLGVLAKMGVKVNPTDFINVFRGDSDESSLAPISTDEEIDHELNLDGGYVLPDIGLPSSGDRPDLIIEPLTPQGEI